MKTYRQLVFSRCQAGFMINMMKLPFVKYKPETGGWLLDPFTDKILAGAFDYEAPKILACIISFIICVILESWDSINNQKLCLKYGLIVIDEKWKSGNGSH